MTTKVTQSVRLLGCLLLFWSVLCQTTFGQGTTSTVLSGFVTDAQREPIANATVTAVHVPTNTKFTTVSTSNGRFSFPTVPPGGPYTLTATAEGRTFPPLENVVTSLGQSTDVVIAAGGDEVVHLDKFVI